MSEMIDISKLKTYSKPHKVYIPSKYGVFVKRADLEKILETAHNSDYAKCEQCNFWRGSNYKKCQDCGQHFA